ncbi:hypothetical protein KUTeg_024010 [Tegillarca granosa]|uniref:2-oxo-4-hydroxy-4-carboxy-5-ureidoimidazoline decarboxylase n=1 Tax=Tegillarca granosa TaxID=220873 RepID=A0ABQ9E0B5_TEGGR|nr:hypothetical protein KUTeg_024010 [Tegillarca granosa]
MSGKRGMLRLNYDLAGKLALAVPMSPKERLKMSQLNAKYKEKFGFPFVICSRQNKKEAMLKSLEERSNNSMEQETFIGVAEVRKICFLRLLDIVDENSKVIHRKGISTLYIDLKVIYN